MRKGVLLIICKVHGQNSSFGFYKVLHQWQWKIINHCELLAHELEFLFKPNKTYMKSRKYNYTMMWYGATFSSRCCKFSQLINLIHKQICLYFTTDKKTHTLYSNLLLIVPLHAVKTFLVFHYSVISKWAFFSLPR